MVKYQLPLIFSKGRRNDSDPSPTSSHPPQGGIILFGKDLLTIYTICIALLINIDFLTRQILTPSPASPSKTARYNSPPPQPPSPASRSPRSLRRHPRPRARCQ